MHLSSAEETKQDRLFTLPFFVISFVNFIIFIGFQMLLPTLPIYAESLGATQMMIGFVSGSISFAAIAVRPFAGKLLDSPVQKIVFLAGILLFGAITLTYGFIGSVAFLIFVRFLHGIGWGVASTGSNTVASEIIPRSRFGEGIGYFTLSTSLAIAIGPALGLTIMKAAGFQMVTLVSLGIMMIALLLALTVPSKQKRLKSDEHSLVEDSVAVVHQDAPEPEGSGAHKWFEPKAIRPAIMMALVTASIGVVNGFLALYALGFGVENVAAYFVVYSLAMIVSRPTTGKILDRYGPTRTLVPGLILVVLGLMWLSVADSLGDLILVAALYGVGFAAAQTTLQSIAVRDVPIARRGVATSTFFVGFDLGIGVGAITGGIVAQTFGYPVMYFALAMTTAVALVLYLISITRERNA